METLSDRFPMPILKVNVPMRWTLYHDFLVAWQDPQTQQQQYLGKLESVEYGPKEDWCFVLGHNTGGEEAMMFLHVPLKPISKSKHTGDIYWMLPIDSVDAGASSLEHGVAQCTSDKSNLGEGTNAIHLHLEFMKPGYVLMPVPAAGRPSKGRPRQLLSSLQSLSRTTSFDLYISNSTTNADLIGTLFQRLSEGSLCTPMIDHKSTFSGRRWGRDAWEAYGLQENVVGESPPLYEEVIRPDKGTPTRNVAETDTSRKSPPSGPINASTNADGGIEDVKSPRAVSEDAISETPADAGTSATDPMQLLLNHREIWPQPRASCSLPDTASPSESESHPSDGASKDREEECHQQGQGEDRHRWESGEWSICDQKREAGLLPSPENAKDESLRKRKASEALPDSDSSSDSSSDPPYRTIRETRPTKERKRIAKGKDDTPYEQPRIPNKLPTAPESELRLLRTFMDERLKFCSCSAFCSGPNSDLFDNTQYAWFIELVLWMRALWCRQSNFNEVYVKELIAICQAVRIRDRRRFETIRLQCMSSFVRGERKSNPLPRGPFGYRVKDRTEYIVKFLYHHVGPGTDVLAVDELIALNHVALAWESFGGEDRPKFQRDQEWHLHARSFLTQMCACVLVALYRSPSRVEVDSSEVIS